MLIIWLGSLIIVLLAGSMVDIVGLSAEAIPGKNINAKINENKTIEFFLFFIN